MKTNDNANLYSIRCEQDPFIDSEAVPMSDLEPVDFATLLTADEAHARTDHSSYASAHRLRGMLRRAIRSRTGQNMDVTIVRLGESTGHLEFRLAYGQWITSCSLMLVAGDDEEDVRDVVALALIDLLEDMIAHPAV